MQKDLILNKLSKNYHLRHCCRRYQSAGGHNTPPREAARSLVYFANLSNIRTGEEVS